MTKISIILVKMTDTKPQPTSNPTYQTNTLELKNNINNSHQNFSMSEKISYMVVLIILLIHVYLIYQTQDIIYRVILIICFITIVWFLNKKNKNQNINTVIDDNGINIIEG
jgi:L-asparagine transporter-like permease